MSLLFIDASKLRSVLVLPRVLFLFISHMDSSGGDIVYKLNENLRNTRVVSSPLPLKKRRDSEVLRLAKVGVSRQSDKGKKTWKT